MLASILAALRIRDQTAEGQFVEVTLQRTGLWAGLATGGHNPDGSPAYVTRSLLGMSPEHGLGVATTPGLL